MRRTICAIAVSLFILSGFGSAHAADPYEASVRVLRDTVTTSRDGRHIANLHALRQLRDPSLQPLFERLMDHDDWAVQTHAALALATLDGQPLIPIERIRQCVPNAQGAIVATAIESEDVGSETLREVLSWAEFPDAARLRVLLKLHERGETVPRDMVARLAATSDLEIAGVASALMSECGDLAMLSDFDARLAGIPASGQRTHREVVLMAIRRHGLASARPWIERCLNDHAGDRTTVYAAIGAALTIDPVWGMQLSREAVAAKGSRSEHVRHVMMRMMTSPPLPAKYFRDQTDDDMIQTLQAMGVARATGENLADATRALLALRHRRCTAFALDMLTESEPDLQRNVYWSIINDAIATPDDPSRLSDIVTVASALYDLDPVTMAARLQSLEDDSPFQQAMMLGLIGATDPSLGDAAQGIRRIGSNKADSIALLLVARYTESLEPTDLVKLGRLAAGGGELSDALRVQACWLYVQHADRLAETLARIFES
ncbi:MAG: hypothetical protein AAF432_10445 [Planctomycetota bacterium]